MHAARLGHSDRLQRVRALLADGLPHSTMGIIAQANVCAVNSIVAELRYNGVPVTCQRIGDVWFYSIDPTALICCNESAPA